MKIDHDLEMLLVRCAKDLIDLGAATYRKVRPDTTKALYDAHFALDAIIEGRYKWPDAPDAHDMTGISKHRTFPTIGDGDTGGPF